MKKYGEISVGFTEDCIFSTQEEVDINNLFGMPTKKQLGENSIVIAKEKISTVKALQNEQYGVLIEAKGLGDSIGVGAGTEELQLGLINDVAKFLGKTPVIEEKELSTFKKMFGSLFMAAATALITYLLNFAVKESISEGIKLSGEFSGKKGMLASIGETLGATGVLIAGGIVIVFFIIRAIKKSKTSLIIKNVSFT